MKRLAALVTAVVLELQYVDHREVLPLYLRTAVRFVDAVGRRSPPWVRCVRCFQETHYNSAQPATHIVTLTLPIYNLQSPFIHFCEIHPQQAEGGHHFSLECLDTYNNSTLADPFSTKRPTMDKATKRHFFHHGNDVRHEFYHVPQLQVRETMLCVNQHPEIWLTKVGRLAGTCRLPLVSAPFVSNAQLHPHYCRQ